MTARTSAMPPQPTLPTFAPLRSGLLQRKCACGGTPGPTGECEACRKKRLLLQRKTRNSELGTRNDSAVLPIVHEVLRSPGQPLDTQTRAFFEQRFGHDFSQVRVHTGGKAQESSRAVGALAYTVGRNVVFGAGHYDPAAIAGRRLLAHELTHVVQQRGMTADREDFIPTISSTDRLEEEAEGISNSIERGPVSVSRSTATPLIQRFNGGGGGAAAAPSDHRFAAEGVSVVVRRSCAPVVFGFAAVEDATGIALDRIFNSECIEASRRTRMQRNLTAHGLDIRCRPSANLVNPGACAESTGFFIPANIFTLGSRSFVGHPDSSAACLPLEATILHEIVHLTRGFAQESLPSSCEASCFGVGGGDPTLCRDIDVFGNRRAP